MMRGRATRAHARRLPAGLAIAAVVAAIVAVVLIGAVLLDALPFAFDRAIITGLRRWGGPAWLGKAAVDITALGGGVVLTLIVVFAATLLAVQRLWLSATMTLLASWSGGYGVDMVKDAVVRARPDLVPHLVRVDGYSFPSGHAASSAVVYLTLAAIASQVTPDRAIRRFLFGAAALLIATIGASRVYLGVHWPSDVLAGWSFGTLWALAWWQVTAMLRTRIGGERQAASDNGSTGSGLGALR